jgi:hypothetical protein
MAELMTIEVATEIIKSHRLNNKDFIVGSDILHKESDIKRVISRTGGKIILGLGYAIFLEKAVDFSSSYRSVNIIYSTTSAGSIFLNDFVAECEKV